MPVATVSEINTVILFLLLDYRKEVSTGHPLFLIHPGILAPATTSDRSSFSLGSNNKKKKGDNIWRTNRATNNVKVPHSLFLLFSILPSLTFPDSLLPLYL